MSNTSVIYSKPFINNKSPNLMHFHTSIERVAEPELAAGMKIGFSDAAYFGNRNGVICFPYTDFDNSLKSYLATDAFTKLEKAMSLRKQYGNPSGTQFFNLSNCLQHINSPIVITTNEWSALRFEQAGIPSMAIIGNVPSNKFFAKLSKRCRRHGVVLVSDGFEIEESYIRAIQRKLKQVDVASKLYTAQSGTFANFVTPNFISDLI